MTIKDNVNEIRSQIAEACRKAGRAPAGVTLVAVTKFAILDAIQQAIDAGVRHIAENRVQEAESKFPPLLAKNPGLSTHIIGHLQTNKAKDAIKVASLIQSVDSLKLAEEIQKHALKTNKPVDVLVQFNTANEEQKFGAAPEEAYLLIEQISQLTHVRIKGLMAMAPMTQDEKMIRLAFSDLRIIRDDIVNEFKGNPKVETDILSMGMSGDYKIAIEEGSTMVRVGSAIFKNG